LASTGTAGLLLWAKSRLFILEQARIGSTSLWALPGTLSLNDAHSNRPAVPWDVQIENGYGPDKRVWFDGGPAMVV